MKDSRSLKVGYAYVVADIFHVGHLKHLQRCKKNCNKLIVGVLTDEATMEKKRRPIIPYRERLEIVKSLNCVDAAVKQKTYSPLPNVRKHKPDILFESVSHTEEAIKEAKETMKKLCGKVMIMPYYAGQSSTAIKTKVVKEWGINPEKMIEWLNHENAQNLIVDGLTVSLKSDELKQILEKKLNSKIMYDNPLVMKFVKSPSIKSLGLTKKQVTRKID